jgi:hypothetical protein
MTQPIPTPAIRDGISVQRFFYPESNGTIDEYYEDGCLVQVSDNIAFRQRRGVNVRLPDGYWPEPIWHRLLMTVYARVCSRHGVPEQFPTKHLDFLRQTKGRGVLWSG